MLAALAVLTYSRPAGAVLGTCSLLIGIARILSLVHSPIDISGSVVIAGLSSATAAWLYSYVIAKTSARVREQRPMR